MRDCQVDLMENRNVGKILLLKPSLLTRANGGEISMIERLNIFKAWGHEIQVHLALDESQKSGSSSDRYNIDGLDCRIVWGPFRQHELADQGNFDAYFRGILDREKPDLVITHYTDYFATTAALAWSADKTWVDQTDDEYPRLDQLKKFGRLAQGYSRLRHQMVASRFMEKSVKKSYPETKVHLCPNILLGLIANPELGTNFKKESYWLHINPIEVKGIDFTLELAKIFPNEKFLLVGNWGGGFPDDLPANVSTLERQASLERVLKEAKGVLMPSQWQEAFGRVPLEAMAFGCPVIASNRGALPETVGQGGIVLPLDLGLWKLSMEKSGDFWTHQIAAGFQRFALYRREVDAAYERLKIEFPC